MTGFDNHKVVTSKNLSDWLYNVASDHGESIWVGGTANYITLTKADIINEVWATYSTDENTTGIYITGYSVGDGKSGYADNQNVIAADIAYREASVTPPDRVFKVFWQEDPDETNKGYMSSNTVGETVTFVVRTDISKDVQNIFASGPSYTHSVPSSVVYDSMSDYYYYTFDVELNTINPNANAIGEVFTVYQGSSTQDVVVYIPGLTESTGGELYTEMPYTYSVGGSSYDSTNGYDTTNSYSYSFVAKLGSGSGTKTITFPQTAVVGSRLSTRSNIPGVADNTIIRNGFKINQPAVFQLNVGKRTFTPRAAHTMEVQPDSTVLFSMSMNVSGSSTYYTPYTDYFVTSGTNIALDTTFGTNGATKESGSLKAKLADSGDTGTLTIDGRSVSGTPSANDWYAYDQYSADPDVFNIDKLDGNITLNNAGNFRIIAYKQSGTTLRLAIAGNGSNNDYPQGYQSFVAAFGTTISGTMNGNNTTFNIVRPKFSSYVQSSIYVDIPNYDSASTYVINIPTDQATFLQDQTLCALAYSFGSGVKCLDPDAVTTRLWKPSSGQISVYENLSEIRLCDVYMRDGNVPRCEKSYIKFRMVDDTKELIQYEVYVDNISSILQELSNATTLQIRITSIYDSSAKRHDEFDPEPGINIIPGYYYLDNKHILVSVTLNESTPHFQFCTTGGKYANEQNGVIVATDTNVETYAQAATTFDDVWHAEFYINGGIGLMDNPVFDGFVELPVGSSVEKVGRVNISYN